MCEIVLDSVVYGCKALLMTFYLMNLSYSRLESSMGSWILKWDGYPWIFCLKLSRLEYHRFYVQFNSNLSK